MKRSISATRLAWLRAAPRGARAAPRARRESDRSRRGRRRRCPRPARRSPSPCGSRSTGRGRRAPRCRRRRRESSPATRATRGPGGWSARRAAGGPGGAGAGVPAPPACAIRRRTRASGRWTSSGLKPSPLRITLAWASRRYPPRASKRCWTSPYRSSRAGSASGRGHVGGQPLELGLEAPDLVEARQRLRQHGAAPRCSRRPAPDSRRSRRCRVCTRPASGSSTPARMRQSVVLPAPFGPTRPIRSPRPIRHEQSVRRVWPPYPFETVSSAITAAAYPMVCTRSGRIL